MKPAYIIAAVALLLVIRAKPSAAAKQVTEAIPVNGTDWQGSAWDRLGGADLWVGGYPAGTCF